MIVRHLEDSWQELVNLTASCAEENLVDNTLVEYEVRSLKDKIMRAQDQYDATQLERLSHETKSLLAYKALFRQTPLNRGPSVAEDALVAEIEA